MDMAAWLAAIAAVLSLVVSIAALIASVGAKNAAEEMSQIDQKIETSLLKFKDVLAGERVFASEEVTDLRLKGVDNSLRDLGNQATRNSEQIQMIFRALLSKGIDAQTRER